MNEIETDYLVIGAGASAMAFVDTLIAGSDADIVMVERRHQPGGHWNDAYPFVRIHHCSANYGCNSTMLGTNAINATGPDAGMYERANSVEVCAYFQRVLETVLLASGQVRLFEMCNYVGDWKNQHAFTSRISGLTTTVKVRKKIVDTTYLEVTVPATHIPGFDVDPHVQFIPAGGVVDITKRPAGYTILGGGKTAMDTINWLLDHGEEPDHIRWVTSREPWFLDRMATQPLELITQMMDGYTRGIEILAQAKTASELWARLEDCGQIYRVDKNVEPTAFRGAIVSAAEREGMARIERVVRQGYVKRIGTERVIMAEGEIPSSPDEIYVDCTARGFKSKPQVPIFGADRIVLQSMVGGWTTYYAALIAYIESTDRDDTEKNRLSPPTPQIDVPLDWVRYMKGALVTANLHGPESDIIEWQNNSRLNIGAAVGDHVHDPVMQAALRRWEDNAEAALSNGERLLGE